MSVWSKYGEQRREEWYLRAGGQKIARAWGLVSHSNDLDFYLEWHECQTWVLSREMTWPDMFSCYQFSCWLEKTITGARIAAERPVKEAIILYRQEITVTWTRVLLKWEVIRLWKCFEEKVNRISCFLARVTGRAELRSTQLGNAEEIGLRMKEIRNPILGKLIWDVY